MEGFLPETQENLCGEHTVRSREWALAYRQIAGRDQGVGGGRHSLLQARESLCPGWKLRKEGRLKSGPHIASCTKPRASSHMQMFV